MAAQRSGAAARTAMAALLLVVSSVLQLGENVVAASTPMPAPVVKVSESCSFSCALEKVRGNGGGTILPYHPASGSAHPSTSPRT
jgi:hypothetical protein